MKTLGFVLLGLILVSCGHSTTRDQSATLSPGETTHVAGGATISASPNPVPTNAGKGVTIISWNSGTAKDCQVYVSDNGAPENLFARGKEGSTKVDWIQSKHHYDFRLYQGSERSKLLSEVKVMPQ